MLSFSEIRPWTLEPLRPEPIPAVTESGIDAEAMSDPDTARDALAAAWEEGFQAGYRDGLRAAREEQEGATLRLIQLAQQAFLDAHEFTRALEREVVDFSLAIAEKVTESTVRVDRGAVLDVVRAALTELQHATVVRVRVNPADMEVVSVQWDQLVPRNDLRGAELVPDEQVEPGGCVIETGTGMADGQLSTKLTQIAAMFQAVAEGEPA
jgi:flagellar assembly protein FliH